MSLKQLQLIGDFAKSTANDTETCSLCRSVPKSREISRRHNVCQQSSSPKKIRHSFTMFHKFLLIYAMLFLTCNPLVQCARHQHSPSGGVMNHVTPATNSIDNEAILSVRSEVSSSEDSSEESDEEHDETTVSPLAIQEAYEKQFKTYTKGPYKTESANVVATTSAPPSPLHHESPPREGSCSSSACHSRKTIEEANTESIKKHILMKLGMEHEPNKTSYPKYSEKDLARLCQAMNLSVDNCLNRKSPSVEYQSDDPTDMNFDDFSSFDGDHDIVSSEEDVQFLSFENRIYAFPSTSVKPRHKSHLVFQFTESQETNNVVAQAILNVFVHSKTFLRSNDVQFPKSLRCIDIEIGKILQGSQHKLIFKTFQNISMPDDGSDGHYVHLNITEMVAKWFLSHEAAHGMSVKIFSSETGQPLPHRLLSLDAENLSTRPFIDILPRDQRKKRTKRSSLRCSKGSNESRCCRHELTVDFDKFGWDWIIAPKKYDANYCAGECKIAFMQQYAHTHVMQLSTAANPCCSPRKMTHMQLLYFDSQLNIVLGTIPNMIVEECFCS